MKYIAQSFSGFEHKTCETFADAQSAAIGFSRTSGLPALIYRSGVELAVVYNDDRGTVIR